jgi:hypothetical protein
LRTIWLENFENDTFNTFSRFANYLATFTGTAPQPIILSMYEGMYGSNGGCGCSYQCQAQVKNAVQAVTSVMLGSATTLTVEGTSYAVTIAPNGGTFGGSLMTIGGTITGAFTNGQQI